MDLKKNPPIVRLRLRNQYQNVRARIFWVNTIANGLANEALTGRIQNRTSSPRLSRGCHCPQHLADDSLLLCRLLRQAEIECLTVVALGPSLDDSSGWNDYLDSLQNAKSRRGAESMLTTRKKMAQAMFSGMLSTLYGSMLIKVQILEVSLGQHLLIQCMHLKKVLYPT
jgi:hypothetical protein